MKTSTLDSLMYVSRSLSVLFVEDDYAVRQEMVEILGDIFSQVIVAKDGQDGLIQYSAYRQAYARYPDIIITDITMPHVSGVEMSRQMLSLNPEQAIVVLSASDDTQHVLELLNMGVDAYTLKPIQHEVFLQTLHRVSKKVSYKKMAEEYTKKLEKMAYIDPLTGISNRRRFFKRAKTLLTQTLTLPPMTLCMLDIDRFKEINDTCGHDMGDAVIMHLVRIVQKELDEKEYFARFGGDEFIIIFHRPENEVQEILENIHRNIADTHTLLGKKIDFSISIGWTKFTASDTSIDHIIKRADLHMYEVKVLKKHDFIEFSI